MNRWPYLLIPITLLFACTRDPSSGGTAQTQTSQPDGSATSSVTSTASAVSPADAAAPAPEAAPNATSTGPLPQPPAVPFVSNPAFADCVHPGVIRDCSDGWCRIPAGCYVYGSPEDEIGRAKFTEEQSRVTLTRDFEIQATELTQSAWKQSPWPVPPAPDDVSMSHCELDECPVDRTSWFWALRYANWLSEQNGFEPCFEMTHCEEAPPEWVTTDDFMCDVTLRADTVYDCQGYRLPTSAEWEYAARAGTVTPFYSGPMLTDFNPNVCNLDPNLARVAWYCHNIPNAGTKERMAQPVGLLEPNAWGLYDVLGNVAEWVLDEYGGVAWPDPYVDPIAELSATVSGTVRNCPFFGWHTLCRASEALNFHRASRLAGFRLARTLGPGSPPTLADVASTAP